MAKTRTRKVAGKSPKADAAPAAASRPFRARIRMYRHGLGDCFLITLPRTDAADGRKEAFVMIDCGLILGTADATGKMKEVVKDIAATTGGVVDLLAVTHEHWDHVSGFAQAKEEFDRIRFRNVWFGWTENPGDEAAQQLIAHRSAVVRALADGSARLRAFGADTVAGTVKELLSFFGVDPTTGGSFAAAGGNSTRAALEIARGLAGPNEPSYRKPTDSPQMLEGTRARLYVLGPPLDEKLLRTSLPSKRDPQTYGLNALFLDETVRPPLAAAATAPFGPQFAIPYEVARRQPFFAERYWGGGEEGGAWRRIDDDWLGAAADLALRLDSNTNNTSLALAIELDDGEVLLFAADAQVGNWLSWQDLKWDVGDRTVTGPDLLKRTVFYKVGHHGSHNATLRQKGLEQMTNLRLAMIPVDQEMARQKNWGRMPLPELIEALTGRTGGHVVRSDEAAPEDLEADLRKEKDLYYEYTLWV